MNTLLIITLSAVAILLTLIVLLQRGRGGGIAGIFGRGGEKSLLGTKTTGAFTLLTAASFLLFISLAIWLNLHWR